jgi:hypothetical protein
MVAEDGGTSSTVGWRGTPFTSTYWAIVLPDFVTKFVGNAMNEPEWIAKNRRARYNMMPGVETWTAANKLSQEEARDIAVSYVLNNHLTLEKPVTFGTASASRACR